MENKEHHEYSREIPKEAKFVIYLFPATKGSLQMTLLMEWDEKHPQKLEKSRTNIINADLSKRSYGVIFKDKDHVQLPNNKHPDVYLINWELIDKWDLINEMNNGYCEVSEHIKEGCYNFIKTWKYIEWCDDDRNYCILY